MKKFETTMAKFCRHIFNEKFEFFFFFFIVVIQIAMTSDATNSSCKDNKLIRKQRKAIQLFLHIVAVV